MVDHRWNLAEPGIERCSTCGLVRAWQYDLLTADEPPDRELLEYSTPRGHVVMLTNNGGVPPCRRSWVKSQEAILA